MVLAGKGSYIYYGRSSTFKGGDRSADKHQAFNPMVKSIDFPEDLRYEIEQHTTFNVLYHNIEFDSKLAEGTVRFTCEFRDPILLATLFTYKGVPGSWTGSSDTMTFNFSNLDNQDKNLWVQLHLHDQSGSSNHLDMFLDGGRIVSYKWMIEPGEPIIEEFEIKFAEINIATDTDSTGAYACDIDNGFDDGTFDQTGVAEVTAITCPAASAITDGQYFKFWLADGAGGWTAYYVWFNKDGGGSDPAPTGYTGISVAISTGNTNAQVATAVGAALDGAHNDFGTPSVDSNVVTVTSQQTGDVKDAVNVDVGTGFSISVSTQGVTPLDGGWSNWDGDYTTKQLAMSYQCTHTFNGSAFSDVDIQTIEYDLPTPQSGYHINSSLSVQDSYLETRGPWKAKATGVATRGNVLLAEPSTLIASKIQGIMKTLYGTTKYLQFTNARVVSASASGIEAGKPLEVTFNLEGGANAALSFSWTASEATDPSAHINHTNT